MDVVVTDHHELPETLPPALTAVNPRRLPPEHPLASLPGVGAAYKLIEGLSARLERPELPETLLDLVALGLVADLATQRNDARYLLQRGLAALRLNRRLGLGVLFELAGVNPETLTEEQIGFLIAPRLNAIGRLADANPVVELLTSGDLSRLRILASQTVIDLFLDEESQNMAQLSDFIGKPVSLQVEGLFTQEQYDIILL